MEAGRQAEVVGSEQAGSLEEEEDEERVRSPACSRSLAEPRCCCCFDAWLVYQVEQGRRRVCTTCRSTDVGLFFIFNF